MAIIEVNRIFTFAASHFLTKYHGKCENLHGHNYRLIVTVEGEVDENGLVIDFKELKEIVNKYVVDVLDHKHLNDIINNPSAEHMCVWIWEHLKPHLPILKRLTVYETDNCYCVYEPKE
jgi:6-pyruvoyltetrahydropterin/6-carboxytetrahydropterin synthase